MFGVFCSLQCSHTNTQFVKNKNKNKKTTTYKKQLHQTKQQSRKQYGNTARGEACRVHLFVCTGVRAYLQWRSVWAVWLPLPPLPLRAGGWGCSWPPSCQIQSTGNGPPDWPSWWHWELPCKDIHVWIWREHRRCVQCNIYYTEAPLALSVSFGHCSSWVRIVLRFISLKGERQPRRNYRYCVSTGTCFVLFLSFVRR